MAIATLRKKRGAIRGMIHKFLLWNEERLYKSWLKAKARLVNYRKSKGLRTI